MGSLRAGSTALYQSSFESYLLQLSDMAAAYGSFMDERNAKTSTVQFILKTKE